jgi:hypothetical protein
MATTITDDSMREKLAHTKSYTVIILKATEKFHEPGAEKVIWEHGRRNFQLREDGLLAIVCAINDGSGVTGVGIFNATPEETKQIYDEDPAVQQGIMTFEVHPCQAFPGDSLPA